MANGCRKVFPRSRAFKVLEDSDPTRFKSNKSFAAKRAAKITSFDIPKRSPDLNVLDYTIWKQVNNRMRRQEPKFPKSKRETRDAYIARLRRAAMSLPRSVVRRSIGNMKWRCEKIYRAKGGHIEEGGRHK